jgi:hypothetical protein
MIEIQRSLTSCRVRGKVNCVNSVANEVDREVDEDHLAGAPFTKKIFRPTVEMSGYSRHISLLLSGAALIVRVTASTWRRRTRSIRRLATAPLACAQRWAIEHIEPREQL